MMVVYSGREAGIHVNLQSRGLCSLFKHRAGRMLDFYREECVTSSVQRVQENLVIEWFLKSCHSLFQGSISLHSEVHLDKADLLRLRTQPFMYLCYLYNKVLLLGLSLFCSLASGDWSLLNTAKRCSNLDNWLLVANESPSAFHYLFPKAMIDPRKSLWLILLPFYLPFLPYFSSIWDITPTSTFLSTWSSFQFPNGGNFNDTLTRQGLSMLHLPTVRRPSVPVSQWVIQLHNPI